jgi:hypothetical protein
MKRNVEEKISDIRRQLGSREGTPAAVPSETGRRTVTRLRGGGRRRRGSGGSWQSEIGAIEAGQRDAYHESRSAKEHSRCATEEMGAGEGEEGRLKRRRRRGGSWPTDYTSSNAICREFEWCKALL